MKIMRNAWFISIALLQPFNWFLSIAFTGIFVPTRDVQHTTKIDQNRYNTGFFCPHAVPSTYATRISTRNCPSDRQRPSMRPSPCVTARTETESYQVMSQRPKSRSLGASSLARLEPC